MRKRDNEEESGAAMVTEKRAEIARDKKHRREWATWLLVVIVVLLAGVTIWRPGFWTDESIARLDAMIEEEKKATALLEELRAKVEETQAKEVERWTELEELRAEVEELRERIAQDRPSP